MNPVCPVCLGNQARWFQDVDLRRYWRCERCQATFLDPDQLPDRATEKSEYDRHQNDPHDSGYRRFLGRLTEALLTRLAPGSEGLDYGCGPGPALARMMTEAGHKMAVYDPIYAPDRRALDKRYDFITCTETAEHFHHAYREFERLNTLVKPGGWLALMTRFQTDDDRFANWHYRRDPTHVVFYRPETFDWLGQHWSWEVEIMTPDRVLVRTSS
ncbi:MAG: class I SAM-dependent methyltransferase [Wenzhouxiangella sp.]|nr:MAG: class I SAM-dependent methyltransferase [Wenzhouxiangella sp.]